MEAHGPPFDDAITFLYVQDLDRSSVFYGEVLELPLALDQGSCRIYRISAHGFVGVCRCSEGNVPSSSGLILTLLTQDVDGWYERLLERGVLFDKPPAYNPKFKIYHCFLRDPDGYLIEIQRFEDPGWNEDAPGSS